MKSRNRLTSYSLCQLQDAWPREAREDWGAGPGPHPLPRGLDGHEAGGHGQAIRLQEVLLVKVKILQNSKENTGYKLSFKN